jgi:hypothetical protein
MSWQRLESSTIGFEFLEGQEARIADPLWLIGRQWQVGELTGEDAASPILVEARVRHTPLTRFRPGIPFGIAPVSVPMNGDLPLETAVEREPVRAGPAAARVAAEASLQLKRVLVGVSAPAALVPALRKRFPFVLPPDDGLDPVGRAQLELLAGRSVAAGDLCTLLLTTGPNGLKGLPGLTSHPVQTALVAWARWYDGLFSEPGLGATSWSPQRMEYRFQVAAGVGKDQEVQLAAAEYTGGSVDWYSFDLNPSGSDMGARGELVPHDLSVVPTPVRYAGQAASRWWQVEHADVWFGDLNTAPSDLARAAVGAYGLLFGDDYFLVPCRLPAGVLARCEYVRVLDTFGERHTIRSCAEEDGPGRQWRFFELSEPGADVAFGIVPTTPQQTTPPWLLLPPALAGRTESRPIEEIALSRDEVANMAWATELRIESAAGRVVDRAARARAAMPPAPRADDDAWRYRLSTQVPEHQVPLVPVRSTADGGLYLQRGRLAVSAQDEVVTRGALGEILEPDRALAIHDDEIPATGARVTRTWQMARTARGGSVLWVGRRKRSDRPPRSPGLVFDEVLR